MNIITIGDPVLEQKAALIPEIDEKIKKLAGDMIDAMHNGNGIGLAAPQVAVLARMFVCHVQGDTPRVFINPEIINTSQETVSYEEGCLSIPGVYADVIRPARIKIQAWNENGKPFTLEAQGILARVIQHEYDHLNGRLFITYLDEKKRQRLLKNYNKKKKA